jgi:molybdopterin converting factor small subunit
VIIVVHLFGPARDVVGGESIEVETADGSSVADLIGAIRRDVPALAHLLGACRLAIDLRYASSDDPIPADVEVALIPPVAGG